MRRLDYKLRVNGKDANGTTFLHDDGTFDATLEFYGHTKVVAQGTFTEDKLTGSITLTHESGSATLALDTKGTITFSDLKKEWVCAGRAYTIEVK